jgi:hypothetical protein
MQYLTGRYFRSKASPTLGAALNAGFGKNYIGEPTDLKDELFGKLGPLGQNDPIFGGGLFSPLSVENFTEAAQAEGLPGFIKMTPEFFGIGTARYGKPEEFDKKIDKERNSNRSPEEIKRRIDAWRSLKKRAEKFEKK